MTDKEVTNRLSEEIISDEEIPKFRELTTYSYISNHLCFEYFVGYEIAALLGYKNPSKTTNDYVSKSNQLVFRDYPGIKNPEINPKATLITRDGVIEILLKTRKRLSADATHLLKEFKIDITNKKCLTKEQQTLSAITNAFKMEKYEDQYKIGNYYVDLYFSEYQIVVECDENGHLDRKPANERERMNYVNLTFGIDDSNWIRYNPDDHDFDISKVIGKIYALIDKRKEEKHNQKYNDLLQKITKMDSETRTKFGLQSINDFQVKTQIESKEVLETEELNKTTKLPKMHKCDRCGYETMYKTHLQSHLNKKKRCLVKQVTETPSITPIFSLIAQKTTQNVVADIENSEIDGKQCQYCLKTFTRKSGKDKHLNLNRCKKIGTDKKKEENVIKDDDAIKTHIDAVQAQINMLTEKLNIMDKRMNNI